MCGWIRSFACHEMLQKIGRRLLQGNLCLQRSLRMMKDFGLQNCCDHFRWLCFCQRNLKNDNGAKGKRNSTSYHLSPIGFWHRRFGTLESPFCGFTFKIKSALLEHSSHHPNQRPIRKFALPTNLSVRGKYPNAEPRIAG